MITHFEADTDLGGRVSRMRMELYRPLDLEEPIDPTAIVGVECCGASAAYAFPPLVIARYLILLAEDELDDDCDRGFFAVEADDIDDAYSLAIEILSAARYARRKVGEGQ